MSLISGTNCHKRYRLIQNKYGGMFGKDRTYVMHLLPPLSFGLANHWIFLVFYAAALILSTMRLSKEKREWLFADPKDKLRGTKKLILRLGQLIVFALLIIISLTPLYRAPFWLSLIGLGFYAAGITLVVLSIYYFGMVADGQPGCSRSISPLSKPAMGWVVLCLAWLSGLVRLMAPSFRCFPRRCDLPHSDSC